MIQDFVNQGELDKGDHSSDRLAYIKVIDVIDVAEARALDLEIPSDIELPSHVKLYVLYAANGTVIGISDSWAAAYSAAEQNNLVPVSVH